MATNMYDFDVCDVRDWLDDSRDELRDRIRAASLNNGADTVRRWIIHDLAGQIAAQATEACVLLHGNVESLLLRWWKEVR